MQPIFSLEVTRYTFEYVNGDPKIVIHQVKALDENGKYIKFLKLEDIKPHMDMFPVVFKSIDTNRPKYALTRADLRDQTIPFEDVSAYDLLPTDRINKASKIIFVDGDKIKVLKQRMSS